MSDAEDRWACVHLRGWRLEGDLDSGYDTGGHERVNYRCSIFAGEGVIIPATRCGHRCEAYCPRSQPRPVLQQLSALRISLQHLDKQIDKLLEEDERVARDLHIIDVRLIAIDDEMESLADERTDVVEKYDSAKSDMFDKLQGRRLSLQDLAAKLSESGERAATARHAQTRLESIATRQAVLRRNRKDAVESRNRLLPKQSLAIERKLLLARLRTALKRLVESAFADKATQGPLMGPPDFDALMGLLESVRKGLEESSKNASFTTLAEAISAVED